MEGRSGNFFNFCFFFLWNSKNNIRTSTMEMLRHTFFINIRLWQKLNLQPSALLYKNLRSSARQICSFCCPRQHQRPKSFWHCKPLHSSQKMEAYTIRDRNHAWVKSHLSNMKQSIQINEKENTNLETVSCGVPQVSFLRSLLFLLDMKDLQNA